MEGRGDRRFVGERDDFERVGAGGMSEVFSAEDSVLHRRVAVKVMHGPIAQDPSFVERFLRDAGVLT